MKGSVSGAMSRLRSRSRGTSMGYDIQPVVKILAKSALFRHLLEIHICGRNHSGIHPQGLRAPQTLNLPFLKYSQEFCLETQRHVADLVEGNGPAMRLLETPGASVDGECAADVTKKLRLEQSFRERAAIDGHERKARAIVCRADGTRYNLFAGTCFACNQNRGSSRRHLANPLDDLLHLTALSDQRSRPALVLFRAAAVCSCAQREFAATYSVLVTEPDCST